MNFGQWTTWWARNEADYTCIKYDSLDLSWQEFNHRINRLAHALQDKGIIKGDRVAVLMANSNVFLETMFAVAKLGAILVPLNFRLSAGELLFIINDAQPIMMLYSPEFKEMATALRNDATSVKTFICEMPGGHDGDLEYESWIDGTRVGEPVPDAEVVMEDPLVIMYTSGTTGRPKGAVISHGNMVWNAINAQQINGYQQEMASLCAAPLFHIGALNVSVTPFFYVGAKIVIQRFFDPAKTILLIAEEKVNIMFGVPTMFQLMMMVPEWETADFSSINLFVAGGASVPKDLIEAYFKKGCEFIQGYGMTETAAGGTLLAPRNALNKIGSAGTPLFHLNIKIVDSTGNSLKAGEIGEILIKGPSIIKQYWNMPEETAKNIIDGWLHTGDLGYFDEDNFLYISDRKKDMYISGGENVYPTEVEFIISRHDKIAEVAVIGVPDEKWGETGMAIIVPEQNCDLTEDEVVEFCRENLAGYKRPKKILISNEILPRTATGKLVKKNLKKKHGTAKIKL
jgi:fatty-acyl-CoA synthase